MQTFKETVEILSQANDLSDIEFKNNSGIHKWYNAEKFHDFFMDHIEIRLKPKSQIIPFTCETVPDNLMIRQKSWRGGVYVVPNINPDHAWYFSANIQYVKVITYQELLEQWEQRDGSPCGIKKSYEADK